MYVCRVCVSQLVSTSNFSALFKPAGRAFKVSHVLNSPPPPGGKQRRRDPKLISSYASPVLELFNLEPSIQAPVLRIRSLNYFDGPDPQQIANQNLQKKKWLQIRNTAFHFIPLRLSFFLFHTHTEVYLIFYIRRTLFIPLPLE